MKRFALVAGSLALSASLGGAALADDHLFNAAHSDGVDNRGFVNPVAGNPSGTSGPAADPGTVPGLGDPKSGVDQSTPSFDPASLAERLATRKGN